jgi:protein-tyrosine phosphatase
LRKSRNDLDASSRACALGEQLPLLPTARVLLVCASVAISASLTASARGIREHPAPGTSLVRFGEVDAGVYKGSKPKTNADFDFLVSKGVKYILDIDFLPLLSGSEKRKARRHGITYLSVEMNASPVPPSTKHVNRILEILRDDCYQPIYFHCDLGRDRTSLVATLYDLYFKGLPQSEAVRQMKDYGFKDWVGLRGLKTYLEKHLARPESMAATRHTCAGI